MFGSINILLNIIVNQYFQDCRCILLIHRYDSDIDIANFPIVIFRTNDNSLQGLRFDETERCEGFLISSDDPLVLFSNLEKYLKVRSSVRYNNRKYVFVLLDNTPELSFDITAMNYVANALIIRCFRDKPAIINQFDAQDNYRSCQLFTHHYVGNEDANNVLYLLDVWDAGMNKFLAGNNLFPDKMSNQYGRVFRIGAADYLPYCFMESQRGTELAFAFEYARRLNMTPTIVSDLNETWGQIYANWTGIGVLGKLVMDEHDISVGALFALPYRLQFSDFSQVTAFSRVTCLVPKPQILEGWLTPITLFAATIWFWFILSYIFIIIMDYVSKFFSCTGTYKERHKKAIHDTIFNIFRTFILQGQPALVLPKEFYRRILHVLNLLLSLIFGVLYCSRLSSSMIVPTYENEINTREDLADSNIKWGELWDDWVLPLQVDTSRVALKLTNKFYQGTEESLRSHSLKHDFAFGMERLPSGFFAIGDFIKDDIIPNYKVMKGDLYNQYAAMQLRKNSVFLDSINKYILLATQSGLLMYWESEASSHHSNMDIQMGVIYPYSEPTLVRIKLPHLKGSFAILFIGYLISFIVFMFEYGNLFTSNSRIVMHS